ncbi:hypothetical protein DY000_02017206 [Brassica cretica]|uniref:Uncharacterized protein n=1 Tax=Brassica cretica TaxID=69181 RepID=A0ABQ7D4X1_BRACR|nr:hypothetical protein DY000_02017206 [Brassica cretica]
MGRERLTQSDTLRSLAFTVSEQAESDVPRATPLSRSRLRFLSKSGATSPERHPQVAPRPVQVPMVKKTKGKSDAEKQKAER